MGWLWLRLGRADWLRPPAREAYEGQGRGAAFWGSVRHDVMHAGGFLVVGAMAALYASLPEIGKSFGGTMELAVFGRLRNECHCLRARLRSHRD